MNAKKKTEKKEEKIPFLCNCVDKLGVDKSRINEEKVGDERPESGGEGEESGRIRCASS